MNKICVDEGAKESGIEAGGKCIESWRDPMCTNVIAKVRFGSEGNLNIQVKPIKSPVVQHKTTTMRRKMKGVGEVEDNGIIELKGGGKMKLVSNNIRQ